jgi:glycosyltransferase involved in cell wall biosynthesis
LVVPSGFLQEVFGEFDVGAVVIPNIIDLETFSPTEQLPTDGTFTMVITRNLEPIYGLDTAIRALALARQEVPVLQLKIAGSGPQGPELERLVDALGLRDAVTFLGRLERPQIVSLYQGADAMLNPSRVDNMPNSVLEALASGLPVISTNVGGVPYIVKDGQTALLVPRDDEVAMARAMVTLSTDSTLRLQLRSKGRQTVEQYAWDKVKLQWLALYNRCGAAV